MKTFSLILPILFFSTVAFSQTSIYGKVTDESTGEELIYANIVLHKNGVFATSTSTDFEGNYSIPVDAGTYDMKICYVGYADRLISEILIKAGHNSKVDFKIACCCFCCFIGTSYRIPLIENDLTTSDQILLSEQIRNIAAKNIQELTLSAPGVSFNNF